MECKIEMKDYPTEEKTNQRLTCKKLKKDIEEDTVRQTRYQGGKNSTKNHLTRIKIRAKTVPSFSWADWNSNFNAKNWQAF